MGRTGFVLVGLAILANLLIVLVSMNTVKVPQASSLQSQVITSMSSPRTGKRLTIAYGCGACHNIPGLRTARGRVGPDLAHLSERSLIAGRLPNNESNLAQWIINPQSINPNTAMPNLGVRPTEARSIAAFLYGLD